MATATETRSRPDGVLLTAIWFVIGAIFPLLGALALLIFAYPAVLTGTATGSDRYMAVAGLSFALLVVIALAAVNIAAAIGLLRLKPWGRILAMVLAALGLLAFPIGTAAGVLILWYLLGDEAREVFTGVPQATATPEIEHHPA